MTERRSRLERRNLKLQLTLKEALITAQSSAKQKVEKQKKRGYRLVGRRAREKEKASIELKRNARYQNRIEVRPCPKPN